MRLKAVGKCILLILTLRRCDQEPEHVSLSTKEVSEVLMGNNELKADLFLICVWERFGQTLFLPWQKLKAGYRKRGMG